MNFESYVYFVESESSPPYVKVGQTDSVQFRVQTIQVYCPHRLSLMGMLKFKNSHHARYAERHIHTVLQKQRTIGEWFLLTLEVREYIRSALSGEITMPSRPLTKRQLAVLRVLEGRPECPAYESNA